VTRCHLPMGATGCRPALRKGEAASRMAVAAKMVPARISATRTLGAGQVHKLAWRRQPEPRTTTNHVKVCG